MKKGFKVSLRHFFLIAFFAFLFFFPAFVWSAKQNEPDVYGLDRVLLEWDSDKITTRMCLPSLIEGEMGYFCDATQFSIMLLKRIEEERSISRLQVLLLADNYSESFKTAFASHYYEQFFKGKKIDISILTFKNSPAEPGLYDVTATVEGDSIVVEFSLAKSLERLDYESHFTNRYSGWGLASKVAENPLLHVAFDAFPSEGERDFGLAGKGESLYLTDSVILPQAQTGSSVIEVGTSGAPQEIGAGTTGPFQESSGSVFDDLLPPLNKTGSSTVEIETGKTFADTSSGEVFSVSYPDGGPMHFKFNKSVPSFIWLSRQYDTPPFIAYYSLVDSSGKVFPKEFFGDKGYLAEWATLKRASSGVFMVSDTAPIRDSFSEQLPSGIWCEGWNEKMPSGKFSVSPGPKDIGEYSSLLFLPEKVSFVVQCVSETSSFEMLSDNGVVAPETTIRRITVEPQKLSFATLQPITFEGEFSLKDVLGEVKKGYLSVSSDPPNNQFSLYWNSKFPTAPEETKAAAPAESTTVCEPLLENGPSEEKLDIVVLSSNFTDKKEFLTMARDAVSNLLSTDPFSYKEKQLNIYAAFDDHMSCKQNTYSWQVSCDWGEAAIAASKCTSYDRVIVLNKAAHAAFNTNMSQGIWRQFAVTQVDGEDIAYRNRQTDAYWRKSFLHELGHLLGLSEESGDLDIDNHPATVEEWCRKNAGICTIPPFLEYLPTGWNCSPNKGCPEWSLLEGASCLEGGCASHYWYYPAESESSIMRERGGDMGSTFSPPAVKVLEAAINYFSGE
ncbi:MAG: M64 family metallo-endopeptidase [Candidatus Diapherotrites archaeon]|nr:M64 family metallo-endopeptidase [Candidatus Diapherotrites archaeon]